MAQLATELPLFKSVSAGFPSPADDYAEERLNLDQYLIKHPSATYFVKVDGYSMIGAGIYPGDILIVDRSLEAQHDKVIIAIVEKEYTVKRFIKEGDKYFLQPENEGFQRIAITPEMDFEVWGVVTHVIHKPYSL